jgi:hypothetical protein
MAKNDYWFRHRIAEKEDWIKKKGGQIIVGHRLTIVHSHIFTAQIPLLTMDKGRARPKAADSLNNMSLRYKPLLRFGLNITGATSGRLRAESCGASGALIQTKAADQCLV